MTNFFHFLQMGGYGIYVWPAYGIVAASLAIQLFLPWRRLQKFRQKQKISRGNKNA